MPYYQNFEDFHIFSLGTSSVHTPPLYRLIHFCLFQGEAEKSEKEGRQTEMGRQALVGKGSSGNDRTRLAYLQRGLQHYHQR